MLNPSNYLGSHEKKITDKKKKFECQYTTKIIFLRVVNYTNFCSKHIFFCILFFSTIIFQLIEKI